MLFGTRPGTKMEIRSPSELPVFREAVLLCVEFPCICDTAHRCSPCLGVPCASILGTWERNPAGFVLTQVWFNTRTHCRICARKKARGSRALNWEAQRC